jgi:site-specific recombinase XerD
MAKPLNRKRKTTPKRVLRLPDLDLAKRTVLNSLGSLDSTRAYAHAIDDFIAWYCSEPRLAFGKHVVLRYRIELESRLLAPATINVRLAAVRRLAYEAADSGLLSPELAAGIRRVKGAKKLGVRLGNWLTVDECRRLLQAPDEQTLKGKRDRSVLAILLGCGLRRAEVAKVQVRDLQRREEHWAIVDLVGKGRHIRTVPVPDWVKATLDEWTQAAAIPDGRLFRCVNRSGTIWGNGITEKVVWHIVKYSAKRAGIQQLAVGAHAPVYVMRRAANWSRFNFYWATFRWRPRSDTWAASSGCGKPSTIRSGWSSEGDTAPPAAALAQWTRSPLERSLAADASRVPLEHLKPRR